MKNLAPSVFRQRLLIEANYDRIVTHDDVVDYLQKLPEKLNLRIYSDPVVYSPGGDGQEINQGYDGFVALIDSGISIYIWENVKFLSVVVYTCKRFAQEDAISFTNEYFKTTETESMAF